MTLTDLLEIERILDDLEIHVQSHIKERSNFGICPIRRLLKSSLTIYIKTNVLEIYAK